MRGEISNSPSNNSLTFTPDNPCQLSVSERAYFESAGHVLLSIEGKE